MSDEAKIQKYFCNACGRKTKHFVRGEYLHTEGDDEDDVSFTQHLMILECCGCEELAFVKRTHFSEDLEYEQNPMTGEYEQVAEWKETIYPPVTNRKPPNWFEDLPDPTLKQISDEIYKSLETESLYLATFGSRTLIDRLILLTVGDKGNFGKGLAALHEGGKLSPHEREILEPVVQAGHAAAHRGWSPTREQINTILDTVEGLIHRLLVLPKLAEELEEAVPGRGPSARPKNANEVTIGKKIANAPEIIASMLGELDKRLKTLGKDVSVHPQKHYIAYKRGRNFASVQIYNQKKLVRVYLNLDPDEIDMSRGDVRDVRQIGHFGTGDLEVTFKSIGDIDKFSDLLLRSYEQS